MANVKTIGYASLAAIAGALIMLGGITLTDEKAYYCEPTKIVMSCDSLSKYYGLDNGKCLNSKIGNKLCTTGWLEITQDFAPEPIVSEQNKASSSEQFQCTSNGCVPK